MGVRGLQTYMEKYCPEARYQVHIPDIVDKYRESTNNNERQVEIVVDANSWMGQWIYFDSSLIGMEIQEIIYRLTEFVKAFRKIDVKLVFFFDGFTPEKKRDTWLKRRKANLDNMASVFKILETDKTLDAVNNKSPLRIRSTFLNLLIYVTLKYELKCEVYNSVFECDEEIIRYAHFRKSFAIFGQDTDFIISRIDAVVLLAKDFDVETMTAYLCDRRRLAQSLRIPLSGLPLYATLLGNDVMPFEKLQNFHCDLTRTPRGSVNISYEKLMPAVGKYVGSLPPGPLENALEQICEDVFGTNYSKDEYDLVKTSCDSYSTQRPVRPPTPTDNWSRIISWAEKYHRNAVNPCIIWSVLTEKTIYQGVVTEDLKKINNGNGKTESLPSCTVSRPLRKRLYGLLLFECEDAIKSRVGEWCPENLDSYKEAVYVTPSEPEVPHPGLLALWRNDESAKMIATKWKLFVHTVSKERRDLEKWRKLDASFVLATATLCYLIEEKYLKEWEVRAFIGTIATFPLYDRKKIGEILCKEPDHRAIHLNTTFIMTFKYVHAIFAASGFPEPSAADNIKCFNFEAKLFQTKYGTARNSKFLRKPDLIRLLCEKNNNCIKRFSEIDDFIFQKT